MHVEYCTVLLCATLYLNGENLNLFPNVDFDSSKEASRGTKRNVKSHKSLLSTFTEKIKKKHVPKIGISGENLHF